MVWGGAPPLVAGVPGVWVMAVPAVATRTATRVALAYRLNTHLLRSDRADRPAAGGRFNLEVRQELPYQPIRGGRLELVLGVRTLFGALVDQASFYDELLTVAPPVRLSCGLQMRF